LLKETTGAFDRAQTHDLHITSQTAPHRNYQPFAISNMRILKTDQMSTVSTTKYTACVMVMRWIVFITDMISEYRCIFKHL